MVITQLLLLIPKSSDITNDAAILKMLNSMVGSPAQLLEHITQEARIRFESKSTTPGVTGKDRAVSYLDSIINVLHNSEEPLSRYLAKMGHNVPLQKLQTEQRSLMSKEPTTRSKEQKMTDKVLRWFKSPSAKTSAPGAGRVVVGSPTAPLNVPR